jgi:hypothetical protein
MVPTKLSVAKIVLGFGEVSTFTGWRVAFDNLACALTP